MRLLLVVAIVVGTYGSARAQMVPPPMVSEPKMTLGISAGVWIPQGDSDEFAETSVGLRPSFAYDVKPFFAAIATFDFIFVSEKDGVGDITYYNFCAGGRLKKPRPGQIEPYGEFLLGFHSLDAEGFDDTAIGFRLGGGVLYPVNATLVANLALNYSAVSFDAGLGGDIDVDAFILEVGIGYRL